MPPSAFRRSTSSVLAPARAADTAAAIPADLATATAQFAPSHGVTSFSIAGSLADVVEHVLRELDLPNLPEGFSPRAEMAREEL